MSFVRVGTDNSADIEIHYRDHGSAPHAADAGQDLGPVALGEQVGQVAFSWRWQRRTSACSPTRP